MLAVFNACNPAVKAGHGKQSTVNERSSEHWSVFSLLRGHNKSNHACSQRLAWMYEPDPSPLLRCCKCVTLARLWCQRATRSALTRTHSCTHLTWASACMKMNSHFLAKALCSRARFSWWSQSGAALGWKVISIQGLCRWLHYPFTVMATAEVTLDYRSWDEATSHL